jgi:hypothetical protein
MPHSRKASNSSLMNRGSSDPVLASVCAMKLAACCCTRRSRGLLRAMPLVVLRGAAPRPLGLLDNGVHARLPRR